MFAKTILVVGAVLLGSVTAAPAPAAVSPRPTVSVKGDTVIGKATSVVSVSSTTTVYNYLGIPFAAAPTGTLRFQPPKTSITLSAPVQATAFPPSCLQQVNSTGSANSTVVDLGPPDSEDCLYLNVFAPTDASSTNKKAVMFWVFGGDLEFGNGAVNYYDGSSFAGFQDVIVVTHNYRTNIFGFSNSPQVALQNQNSGYLDQRAALDWVHTNIASFGGDPDQITIFGESSGGYSVKQLLAFPPSPLNYRAAIIESDALLLIGNATANYEQVATHFGCAAGSSQLSCLQSVNGTEILDYIISNNLQFHPAEDNTTQTNDVRPNIANKKWANVPYLIGTNGQEGRVFVYGVLSSLGANVTIQEGVAFLFPNQTQLQQAVVDAYAVFADSVGNDTYLILSQIVTDLIFTCPTSLLANYTIGNGYERVWRYYYNESFPDLSYYPEAGAYHSSEIPQVFGTYELSNYLGAATPDQEGLSKYMQTAWADFAKNPSNGPGWVPYSSSGPNVGDLGGINATGEVTINAFEIDALCLVLDPVISAAGL